MRNCFFLIIVGLLVACSKGSSNSGSNIATNTSSALGFYFTDNTLAAGLVVDHGFTSTSATMPMLFSSGLAVSDYDNDGDLDIYFVSGTIGANALFQNLGDTTFADIGPSAGVAIDSEKGAGPAFADIDGDGYVDLFVGAIDGDPVHLFRNNRDGTFSEITASSGLTFSAQNIVAAAFGDYDNDGQLDLFVTHWGHQLNSATSSQHLWRNVSDNQPFLFIDQSNSAGLSQLYQIESTDYTFTPNFTDIDSDGDSDLLLAADFSTSKVLRNDQGVFVDITNDQISDENGMGAAVGDYDNDGDMDWFVSAISYIEPPATAFSVNRTSGNRLYNNDGAGNFTDVTTTSGVLRGDWAWGSCFADFNNDGYLDIFHVNGWVQSAWPQYKTTRSKLFLARSDGTFKEVAGRAGINDTNQGRGVVCADMDADGTIDILIANNRQQLRFYRNTLQVEHHYINIRLAGTAPNTQGIGAKIKLEAGGKTQVREMRRGSNFSSQNPARVHFGLGEISTIDSIQVTWPDRSMTKLSNLMVDQHLTITQ